MALRGFAVSAFKLVSSCNFKEHDLAIGLLVNALTERGRKFLPTSHPRVRCRFNRHMTCVRQKSHVAIAVKTRDVPRLLRCPRLCPARLGFTKSEPEGQNLRKKRKSGMPANGVQSAQSTQKYTFTFQSSRRVNRGISTGAMMHERIRVTVILGRI